MPKLIDKKKDEAIDTTQSPIMRNKRYDHASLFVPENLLREARRQKTFQKDKYHLFAFLTLTEISSKI